jgi:hypothetical protein
MTADADEAPRYTVACSGVCPSCHVTVTASGLEAERLPDGVLGGPAGELLCLCGTAVPAIWVGFALAGYVVQVDAGEEDDELDGDEFTNAPAPNRDPSYRP